MGQLNGFLTNLRASTLWCQRASTSNQSHRFCCFFVVNAMVLAILTCFLEIASTERTSSISFSSSLVKFIVWLRRFSHPCLITFMFHLLSLHASNCGCLQCDKSIDSCEVIRRPEDSFLILSKMTQLG